MKPNKFSSVRVLVLDGRIQSCLPLLKSLYLRGHHITIGESDPLCVGFFSRYPHRRIRYRDPGKEPEGFITDLVGYLSKRDYDVLIPILDVTATLVSQYKSYLEKYVRIPLVDYPIFMRARDKSQTMKIAQSYGLPCPKTYFPEETGIEEIARLVDFPILIKPNFSIGARGITKVSHQEELIKLYPLVVKNHGSCTVQEYIPQTDMQYKAQIFLDQKQDVKACIICSKIRYFPQSGGSGTLFLSIKRKDIEEIGIKLLKHMGWYGYGDVDFIADPRDGLIKIMEVNPRLSAPVKICFESGIDIADMLIRFAMRREITPIADYTAGIYLRHEGLDLLWFLTSKERFKSAPSWFRFWGKTIKYQIMSGDDPVPIFAYLMANLKDLFQKEARRYKYQKAFLKE